MPINLYYTLLKKREIQIVLKLYKYRIRGYTTPRVDLVCNSYITCK